MAHFNPEELIKKHRPLHEDDAFSRKHPKMPIKQRAKIFLAFDALRGFDAAIDIVRNRSS